MDKKTIHEHLWAGEEFKVRILPSVVNHVVTFADNSNTLALAQRSVNKEGILQLNWYDPVNYFNIKVIDEPLYFKDLIPYYYVSEGWVLEEEEYQNDTVIIVNSLNCITILE